MRLFTTIFAAVLLLGGCTQEDPMDQQQRAEERAVEARGHIDGLADLIGSGRTVVQDEILDCEPGDSSSGLDLSYIVRVTIGPDAVAAAEAATQDLAADGWTVERDENQSGEVRFQLSKDPFVMTAFVRESKGEARVVGSGGCVT